MGAAFIRIRRVQGVMSCGGLCNWVCALYKTATRGTSSNHFAPDAESSSMNLLCLDQERPEHSVSLAYPAVAPPSFPGHPGASILTDGHFESLATEVTEEQPHYGTGKESKRDRSRATIDMLPNVALLEIFDSYIDWAGINAWRTLVHVCRKWRNIVFGPPRRLDLQLYCTPRLPVREMLDIWPLLPLFMEAFRHEMWDVGRLDNVVAALERNDRICQLNLIDISSSQIEKVLPAMQQPFPALIHLDFRFGYEIDETAPVIPASFLGGSAPRLQTLKLMHVPFPGLPKFLLSATHLVHLLLSEIPHSGYFSPEAIVTSLSVLTRLEGVVIDFESPRSRPDRKGRHPPPATRTLLPVLTVLRFKGASEYLEDLVAQIDAPLLGTLDITFFHQLIFETPRLIQFFSRTPKLQTHDKAQVFFSDQDVSIILPQAFDRVDLGISCRQSGWQLSSLAQVCSSSVHQTLFPALEHLHIVEDRFSRVNWQDDVESSQWLELLYPFTSVKRLYISREFVPRIAPALQELVAGERVTEVLPALQTLVLEEPLPSGPVQETVGQFVAARQLAGHPVTVSQEWPGD